MNEKYLDREKIWEIWLRPLISYFSRLRLPRDSVAVKNYFEKHYQWDRAVTGDRLATAAKNNYLVRDRRGRYRISSIGIAYNEGAKK